MHNTSPHPTRAAVLLGGLVLALTAGTLLTPAEAEPSAPGDVTFYVAPNGSDAWSGTLAEPNHAGNDGPFATVARAQIAVRAALSAMTAPRLIAVFLRAGVYPLAVSLQFDGRDSGSATTAVRWSAYRGETPVISGGHRLTGWKAVGADRYELALPEVAAGTWRFSQLYVNGERRLWPRLPEQGYYHIADVVPPTSKAAGLGADGFRYRAGNVDPNWVNRDDIEVLTLQNWTMSRFPIADIDGANRVITFKGRTRGPKDTYSLPRGNRFLVENVKEALSNPGQWYLDRKTGVLTYLARRGEDPERAEIVAPRLPLLLEMNAVSNLAISGITFADASWNIGPEGNALGQAEIGIPAVIHLTGCRNCVIENCTVRNIGGYAIQFGAGTKHCVLDGCTLRDLGAGGVLLGEQNNALDDEHAASDNVVRNCLIAEGGRIHPAAVGIWIGESHHNLIEHNEIADFYYSGISMGWTWGYKPNDCHHNTIAYNHIHKIGQSVLSDMGGIYTLGASAGSVLDHNRIHDVVSFDYGAWCIYFDEGTSNVLATNNVLYDAKSSLFVQHYGRDNFVRNNIMAFGGEAQIMRIKAEDHTSYTLEGNIIYWKDSSSLGSPWTTDWTGKQGFVLGRNLYWDANPKASPHFVGVKLADWQAKGHDAGSLIADPQFADPDRRDFTLATDSPAAVAIGFLPIDISAAGRLPGAERYDARAAERNRTFPYATSSALDEDWEDLDVGRQPNAPNLQLVEEPETEATICVSDEQAASGKHSLKFIDAAGQKSARDPMLYFKPRLLGGVAVAKFAVRLEPGAVFFTEWRDAEYDFHIGPRIDIDSAGQLTANGKLLTTVPRSQWIRCEITCPLGKEAYDLAVKIADEKPITYRNIAHSGGVNFCSLRWWSFSANGDAPGVLYLDDISLTTKD